MESSIAEFLKRQIACELLPTKGLKKLELLCVVFSSAVIWLGLALK